MQVQQEVIQILDEVLSLNGRGRTFDASTPLLGAVAELDSMAVVALLTTIEERFGLTLDDDDVDGDAFRTVGSLVEFVRQQLDRRSAS